MKAKLTAILALSSVIAAYGKSGDHVYCPNVPAGSYHYGDKHPNDPSWEFHTSSTLTSDVIWKNIVPEPDSKTLLIYSSGIPTCIYEVADSSGHEIIYVGINKTTLKPEYFCAHPSKDGPLCLTDEFIEK